MKATFGILALAINLIGYIPYVHDILRHKVMPQRVTWGIWSILSTIAFANQVINGGGWSVWFFGSSALMTTMVFVLSINRGVGGASRLDKIMLAAAALLLVYWLTLHDTRLSTIFVILIDIVGAIPTVLKAYRRPDTESYPQWVMAAIGGFFSVLAIEKADYILFLYPLYIVAMNTIIVSAKYYSEHYETSK